MWVLALGFLLVLGGIVFRGIREAMWVNVLCTIVEASGLVIVIAVGFSYWGSVDDGQHWRRSPSGHSGRGPHLLCLYRL